MQKGLQWKRP